MQGYLCHSWDRLILITWCWAGRTRTCIPERNPPLINRNPQAIPAAPDQLPLLWSDSSPGDPEVSPGRAGAASGARQRQTLGLLLHQPDHRSASVQLWTWRRVNKHSTWLLAWRAGPGSAPSNYSIAPAPVPSPQIPHCCWSCCAAAESLGQQRQRDRLTDQHSSSRHSLCSWCFTDINVE